MGLPQSVQEKHLQNLFFFFFCRRMVLKWLTSRRPMCRPALSQWAVPTAAEEPQTSSPTHPSFLSATSEASGFTLGSCFAKHIGKLFFTSWKKPWTQSSKMWLIIWHCFANFSSDRYCVTVILLIISPFFFKLCTLTNFYLKTKWFWNHLVYSCPFCSYSS